MIKCTPKEVKRGSILFNQSNLNEIIDLIGFESIDDDRGQSLVNTKRHGWQNVNYGDYLIFDENNRLLKVLKEKDYKEYYQEL